MTTILLAFIVAFLVAVVATRIVIELAWRWGIVDKPDGYRKVHKRLTPQLGGLAIYVAFSAPVLLLFLFPGSSTVSGVLLERFPKVVGLLVCAAMVLALGTIDDIYDLRPRWKLLWQIVIACIVYYFGFRIEGIGNPLGEGSIWLGNLSFPVTVFWFVACMNAVNLLDGIDGLAAGASVFVGLTLFLVSLLFSNVLGMFLMACLSGAALGFLVFNFPPARIFLGDSGSLLLGYLIAALSLMGATLKASTAVALFIPVVALGLPIFDTAMAIVRRWYRGLPLSSPDQDHIHHALVSMGYSPRRAVLILYGSCVVLGGAALLMTIGRSEVTIFVIGSLALMVFICVRLFSTMRFRDVLDRFARVSARRERSAQSRMALVRVVSRLDAARDMRSLWALSSEIFAALNADSARLEWGDASRTPREVLTWTGEERPESGNGTTIDSCTVRLSLHRSGEAVGMLEVRISGVSEDMTAESLELLDRLRCELAERVEVPLHPPA